MKYFEDLKVGDSRVLGSYTFEAEDIKNFARQFDPQPFHLDEEAGRKSMFGGLAASGWHTAAIFMKLNVAARQRDTGEDRLAPGGPAAGFRDMKWLKPVLAGDTLTYSTEVIQLRDSASKPQWGLMTFRNTAVNQRQEPVFSFEATAFMPRRPK